MTTPAERWAAAVLPQSRAQPIPAGPEPADAERLLAALSHQAATPPLPLPPQQETDIALMGVADLLTAYRNATTDPATVLAHLQSRNGNAPEAVLCRIPAAEAAAAESARRYRNGTARPLEGIPFGVKDIIDVAGARVTCGSRHTGDRIATTDATCVARLCEAGAIPAFMLASSEYACGAADNARYGPVPNPWDRTRWAGGSSTGSGAALAARIIPLALGTDTGGSIRIPAALCGITGFKPTSGLISRTGVAPLSWTLDHIGPMARTCDDIARVLPILAGPDGTDTLAAAHTPDLAPRPDITGLRIGVPTTWFIERADSAILQAWRAALEIFQHAGAILTPIETPDLALAHEEAWMILYAELAACQDTRLAQMPLFDAGTQDRIARGLLVSAADYIRALRRRPLIMQGMLDAMANVDVIITPGAGAEAPPLDTLAVTVDGATFPMYEITPRNTMIFDYTGFPALMLPAGLGKSGLPVAIQIVAKPFQDALCLSAGMAFQASTSHHRREFLLV
jgi:aspartyl-tRNA(Asn)/glutamyl-tRNA(Gln) amidotransferase subunit A